VRLRPYTILIAAFLLAHPLPGVALEFASLQRLIEERDVRSIETLLPLLPTGLRSRYALMFRSRSLHGASFDNPRVILYGDDARLVVTFNGDPRLPGFDAVETMEFDPVSKAFSFRQIEFAAAASAPPRISEPNPEPCGKCHGDPPRPVWDTHPLWPGAYGEKYRAPLALEEAAGLKRFLQAQPAHPRYRFLLDAERLADPEIFRPGARARYEGSERESPNAELATLLGRLNFEGIVHELQSRPQFEAYRVSLLAALRHDCGGVDTYLPPHSEPGTHADYSSFVREGQAAMQRQQELKRMRALGAGSRSALGYGGSAGLESLDGFRFIVEQGFGIATANWTLALEKSTYDFTMPESSSGWLAQYFLRAATRGDPKLIEISASQRVDARGGLCEYLVRQRRAASASAPGGATAGRPAVGIAASPAAPDAQPTTAFAHASPPLLQHCIACHTQGVGPALPFDRPAILAGLLASRPSAHGTLIDEIVFRLSPQAGAGRMPLGFNPTEEERSALSAYFENLARRAR
jgi:mono/diheme cytochrome c family protein